MIAAAAATAITAAMFELPVRGEDACGDQRRLPGQRHAGGLEHHDQRTARAARSGGRSRSFRECGQRHQDRVQVLAVTAVVTAAVALLDEAERLVERDRGRVVRETWSSSLATPFARAHSTVRSSSALPIPCRRWLAATISPRSATWRLAGWTSRATDRRPTRPVGRLGHEDGRVRRPPCRAQVAPLGRHAAPLRGREQPVPRLRADLPREGDQLGRVARLCLPDLEAHSTTTPCPPRRGSPAAASVPSSSSSTPAAPPKKRFRPCQRASS